MHGHWGHAQPRPLVGGGGGGGGSSDQRTRVQLAGPESSVFCVYPLYIDLVYDALLRGAEITQRMGFRPGTRYAHRRAIKLFVGFSVYFDKPYNPPTTPHVLAFIQFLAGHMKSPLSVKNTIGALTTAYKRGGRDHTPFASYAVQAALRSLEINTRYIPRGKRGATPAEVERIIYYCINVPSDLTMACDFIRVRWHV